MTQSVNHVTVVGRDFAVAVRRLLPCSPRKDLGGLTIEPAATGIVRLASFYASEELFAEGIWSDPVMVSGRFLRNIVVGDPPAAVLLTYAAGTLTVNGTAVTASLVPDEGGARKPQYVPSNRLGRRGQ
jgi:hypothetical protein